MMRGERWEYSVCVRGCASRWVVQEGRGCSGETDRIKAVDLGKKCTRLFVHERTTTLAAHACRVWATRWRLRLPPTHRKPKPKVSFVRPFIIHRAALLLLAFSPLVLATCPNGCSGTLAFIHPPPIPPLTLFSFSPNLAGHGTCHDGVCSCVPGYTFFDCSLRVCPADCSGKGACFDGTCRCEEGFCGADCALKCCPADCSGHGECDQTEEGAVCRGRPSASASPALPALTARSRRAPRAAPATGTATMAPAIATPAMRARRAVFSRAPMIARATARAISASASAVRDGVEPTAPSAYVRMAARGTAYAGRCTSVSARRAGTAPLATRPRAPPAAASTADAASMGPATALLVGMARRARSRDARTRARATLSPVAASTACAAARPARLSLGERGPAARLLVVGGHLHGREPLLPRRVLPTGRAATHTNRT